MMCVCVCVGVLPGCSLVRQGILYLIVNKDVSYIIELCAVSVCVI